jgi:hypothetical protein
MRDKKYNERNAAVFARVFRQKGLLRRINIEEL